MSRELARLAEMGALERELRANGFMAIAGTDEVGRGCLAGPVVAAAVILDTESVLPRLDDSKRLSAAERTVLSFRIIASARAVAVGVVEPATIHRINILAASKMAMRHAVESLELRPDALLTDAVYLEELMVPQLPIIKGDSRSVSIAAASVVAKVYRDSLMESYHALYPQYDFVNNVGYGTANHCKALEEYGPSPIHRRGFRGVIDQRPLFG
ncbi:MAG: ribonuclease HII [Thermoanaerobaculia bacterium]